MYCECSYRLSPVCMAALSLAEPGAGTPFVRSTVFMCEHSPSPSEVQENLALFAILPQ